MFNLGFFGIRREPSQRLRIYTFRASFRQAHAHSSATSIHITRVLEWMGLTKGARAVELESNLKEQVEKI